MDKVFYIIFSSDFFFTAIRVMTPILYAAMACMVFGKGGIDAIATEGIMLISALAGPLVSYYTNSYVMGVMGALLTGAVLAVLYGYITISLKTDSILTGIALNTFALGITVLLVYYTTGEKGSTQSLKGPVVPNVNIPIIEDIPFIGQVVSGQNLLTYLAFLLLGILAYGIYKTPTGLRIRSVGENPEAAKSVGISVMRYKYIALIVAGSMAGLGGAFMSMGYVSFFSKQMIAGRGFIGMAAESMGRGTPGGILLSSLIFGMADSLAIRLQILDLPIYLIQTIPYVITIVAISVYSYKVKKSKI